jgi:peptidoglycan/xylan/chitin deacetylase (PgdA/CDA1 family)
MPQTGVVFLMYHELEGPGRSVRLSDPGYLRYVVHSSEFRSQMDLLKSTGWRGVSVSEAIRTFARNTVAITFDDGCDTDLLLAAPVLREFAFGATFYITTGWSGQPGFLSKPQIRELSSLGFEIGSHSMNHLYFTDLDEIELRREIEISKTALEGVIGKPVEHLSCPGGRFDCRVAQFAREAGYRTVATSETRANTAMTDLFSLARVAILRPTSLRQFWRVCEARGLWQARLIVNLCGAVQTIVGNSAYDRLRGSLLRIRSCV